MHAEDIVRLMRLSHILAGKRGPCHIITFLFYFYYFLMSIIAIFIIRCHELRTIHYFLYYF